MAIVLKHIRCTVVICTCGLLLFSVVGCGRDPGVGLPLQMTEKTPAGELEWAMTRLRRALDKFGPAAGDSLKIKRSMTHELFPPDDPTAPFTARVTIESISTFRPLVVKPDRTERKHQKQTKQNEGDSVSDPLISDPAAPVDLNSPLEDPLLELQDVTGAVNDNLLKVKTPVEPRTETEITVYELVYSKEKGWQLAKPAESEYEKLLFDYVLER